jgi:peptidoglycan/xylan/chitin deacetylase (PgdA/CDA1 family)
MEWRFGHDFSRVRIHSGTHAAESAQAVRAHAYTVGPNIVFGPGQYAPHTPAGQQLLRHELAHTIQQSASPVDITEPLVVVPSEHPTEAAAQRAEQGLPQGGTVTSGQGLQVARQDVDAGVPTDAGVPADAGIPKRTPAVRTFALTFDDGPHAAELGKGKNRTEKVLDTLKDKGVKGAFFIQTGISYRGASRVGMQLVKRMHDEGHKIGIHTGGKIEHELHTKAQKAGRLEGELEAAKQYIEEQTGEVPSLVRPPTGAFNKAVTETYKKVSLTNLLWDIDGDQGKDLDLQTLKQRITDGITRIAKAGWKTTTASKRSVVLYHDIQKGTAEHLAPLIEHIKDTTQSVSGKADIADFAPP